MRAEVSRRDDPQGPVWGTQVKPKPQPIGPLLSGVAEEGYRLVEWRSPTVSGVTQPEWDLVSDAGSAKEIKAAAGNLGLAMAYHVPQGPDWHFGTLPPDEAVGRLEASIDRAVSIGARTMTIHLGIEEGAGRERSILSGVRAVQGVVGRASDEGVLICVENVFDHHSVSTVEDCDLMFDALDDRVMLTLDTGHGHLCGTLFQLIERFGDRIGFTHVHDNDATADQHLVPGNGTMDWSRLLERLDGSGYTGPLSFELREEASFGRLTTFVNRHRPASQH